MILYKEYSKDELVAICNELRIAKFSISDTSRKLVETINNDLETNGVPEDDECSDLLYNYIRDAGFVEEDDEDEPEPDSDNEPEQEIANDNEQSADLELPDCFGFADERDKACKRCTVYKACMAERIAIRENELPCYGKLYDANDENCKLCLEAGPCRLVILESVKINK